MRDILEIPSGIDWSIGSRGWQGAQAGVFRSADAPVLPYSGRMVSDGAGGMKQGRAGHARVRPRQARLARAGVLLLAMVVVACARPDPEVALREAVAELQSTIEQREPAAMQQHLAEDFIGNDGLDRDGARRLAAGLLLRHRDVAIDTGPLRLELAGEHAVVRFTAMLRGGSGRLLPDAARVYEVETGWRLEDGRWQMTSARWTPALSGSR